MIFIFVIPPIDCDYHSVVLYNNLTCQIEFMNFVNEIDVTASIVINLTDEFANINGSVIRTASFIIKRHNILLNKTCSHFDRNGFC